MVAFTMSVGCKSCGIGHFKVQFYCILQTARHRYAYDICQEERLCAMYMRMIYVKKRAVT